MTRICCVLIIGVFVGVVQTMYWDIYYNVLNNRKRLLQMETMIVTEIYRRFQKTWWIRTIYEESPHFEIGYLFGEVMEKYRKMIEYIRMLKKGEQSLFHTVDWLESVQQLYYEIYHLTMMIHEIPRKWRHVEAYEKVAEFQEERVAFENQQTPAALYNTWKAMKKRIRQEEKEKKQKRRNRYRGVKMKIMMEKMTKMRMTFPSYGYVADMSPLIIQQKKIRLLKLEHEARAREYALNLEKSDPNHDKSRAGVPWRVPAYKGGTTHVAWNFDYGWEPNYDWWSHSVVSKPVYEYYSEEKKRRR